MRCFLSLGLLILASGATASLEGQRVEVRGFRLTPSSEGPELTIETTGAVVFSDFSLSDPARVVIDLSGALEGGGGSRYAVARGGIETIHSTQVTPDRVRIVVELDRPAPHTVDAVAGGLLLRLANGRTGFAGWSAGTGVADDPPTSIARPELPANGGSTVDPPPEREQARITATFRDADLRDVLTSFAEFAGRSIISDPAVAGRVTASIREQPWKVALRTILLTHGYAPRELPGGIIQVEPLERVQERHLQEPLVTQPFRINYVPAAELAASIEPLQSERGRISVNPSTNTIVVTDTDVVLDRVRSVLGQLDVRTPQVVIQAKIIFINRTEVEELGVTYDLKDSQGGSNHRPAGVSDAVREGDVSRANLIGLGGSSIAALGNASIRLQQPQLQAVLSLVLGRSTLIAFVDALQAQDLSDVQAAPLITTLDNQPAEIWVGERTPIRVVDVGSGVGGVGAGARATAELVETGIRLRVTPHITADRRVLMQLHAERSSVQLAATDIGVIFQQQQGTTRLMVEDGETAVIGGLTVTERATTRSGIPILMELPLVGALFRTTRAREQKRDLLIMVTPRILED